MKWVEVAKYFPPVMGGIERVSEACCRAVHDEGHDVHVVAFSPVRSSDAVIRGVGRVSLRKAWIKAASAPLSGGYLLGVLKATASADVVHLHMPNPLGALAVWLRPERYRLLVHWHSDVVAQRRTYRLYKWLESAVLRRAERILVTTSAYADSSSALKPWRHKCVEVPLSAMPSAEVDSDRVVPRTLLACGRLVPYKGYGVLIEAMALLPEAYRLDICGTGPLSGVLADKIRDLGLDHRVKLLGFVDDRRLREKMGAADIFCMPSITRAEAFGVAVLEAFASGLPVVSSALKGSGLKEINKEGVTGLQFPTGDPIGLAEAVRRIAEDRSLREQMAQAALREYRSRYTPESYARRFLEAVDILPRSSGKSA